MSTKLNEELSDPTQRFQKKDQVIFAKTDILAFRAYDTKNGNEVTWYEINLTNFTDDKKKQISKETERMKDIQNPGIMQILHYWISQDTRTFYIITESITSKSLESVIKSNTGPIRPYVLVRWFLPVVKAIDSLHSMKPPVVHSHITADSIFSRLNQNTVKIVPPLVDPSNFNVEQCELKVRPTTPPERLQNIVVPVSDIWTFGIIFLYAYTGKMPYEEECRNPRELISLLSMNKPPKILDEVDDSIVRDMLNRCFKPYKERIEAHDLQNHDFFTRDWRAEVTEFSSSTNLQRLN